ncbi:MAG: inositol phosphorylceramide synthase [Actinomycetia bacterium]|nr:inositol phosphorylceramide synthase [Actinomycetes bacterium]
MWLPWDLAAIAALGFVFASAVLRNMTDRWARVSRGFTVELARMLALYTGWQLAGKLSVMRIDDAVRRGEQIWDLERWMRLPDEAAWQLAIIDHDWLVRAANIHYGGAHVPGMGIFLVWLFVWHRDAYPALRNTLVWITAVSLLIQLVPVAPPRLVPSIDMVDTGILHGQSVYASFGSSVAGQLQAMPSLHAGWAILVAVGAIQVSTSRWRWLALLHPIITMYVIGVTANHYWLDGIVGAGLLWAIMVAQSRAGGLGHQADLAIETPPFAGRAHQSPVLGAGVGGRYPNVRMNSRKRKREDEKGTGVAESG